MLDIVFQESDVGLLIPGRPVALGLVFPSSDPLLVRRANAVMLDEEAFLTRSR